VYSILMRKKPNNETKVKWKSREAKIRNLKSKKPQTRPAFLVWLSNYPPFLPSKQLSRIYKKRKRRQSQHLALRGVYFSTFFWGGV